jgi:hypothetical protein
MTSSAEASPLPHVVEGYIGAEVHIVPPHRVGRGEADEHGTDYFRLKNPLLDKGRWLSREALDEEARGSLS